MPLAPCMRAQNELVGSLNHQKPSRVGSLNHCRMPSTTVAVMLTLATRSSALRSMALRAAATTSAGAVKRVLVPIADGSEEIETSCITDTLVRAGAEVTVASVEATTTCTMSRGLKIVADALVTDLGNDEFDLRPAGRHARRGEVARQRRARRDPAEAGRAASAFGGGLRVPSSDPEEQGFDRRKPSDLRARTRRRPSWRRSGIVADGAVVRDGHITTWARGPGTSLKFALDLVVSASSTGPRRPRARAPIGVD